MFGDRAALSAFWSSLRKRLSGWRNRKVEDLFFPHNITAEELKALHDEAREEVGELSSTVLRGLNPPAGAYAFFNHNAQLLTRLRDCHAIVRRLYSNRKRLTALANEQRRRRVDEWPSGIPYPEDIQKILQEESELVEYMKLDLESLYIVGTLVLDQWALQVIAVGALRCPKRHPFIELLDRFEKQEGEVSQGIWEECREDLLWLHYQMRFYRNRFIVHANRPWQRGTTRSRYGEDFNLFTPTPPGWLNDKQIDEDIHALLPFAPNRIRRTPKEHRERARPGALIERIFDNIGQIESRDKREEIARIFATKGGSTPTFQVLAKRLFSFVRESISMLRDIAGENLETIDLGRPHSTSEEQIRQRLDSGREEDPDPTRP